MASERWNRSWHSHKWTADTRKTSRDYNDYTDYTESSRSDEWEYVLVEEDDDQDRDGKRKTTAKSHKWKSWKQSHNHLDYHWTDSTRGKTIQTEKTMKTSRKSKQIKQMRGDNSKEECANNSKIHKKLKPSQTKKAKHAKQDTKDEQAFSDWSMNRTQYTKKSAKEAQSDHSYQSGQARKRKWAGDKDDKIDKEALHALPEGRMKQTMQTHFQKRSAKDAKKDKEAPSDYRYQSAPKWKREEDEDDQEAPPEQTHFQKRSAKDAKKDKEAPSDYRYQSAPKWKREEDEDDQEAPPEQIHFQKRHAKCAKEDKEAPSDPSDYSYQYGQAWKLQWKEDRDDRQSEFRKKKTQVQKKNVEYYQDYQDQPPQDWGSEGSKRSCQEEKAIYKHIPKKMTELPAALRIFRPRRIPKPLPMQKLQGIPKLKAKAPSAPPPKRLLLHRDTAATPEVVLPPTTALPSKLHVVPPRHPCRGGLVVPPRKEMAMLATTSKARMAPRPQNPPPSTAPEAFPQKVEQAASPKTTPIPTPVAALPTPPLSLQATPDDLAKTPPTASAAASSDVAGALEVVKAFLDKAFSIVSAEVSAEESHWRSTRFIVCFLLLPYNANALLHDLHAATHGDTVQYCACVPLQSFIYCIFAARAECENRSAWIQW